VKGCAPSPGRHRLPHPHPIRLLLQHLRAQLRQLAAGGRGQGAPVAAAVVVELELVEQQLGVLSFGLGWLVGFGGLVLVGFGWLVLVGWFM